MRVKKIARRLFERMLNRFPTTQKALRARGWGKWRPLIPSDEFINICEDIIGKLMALEHEFGDYLEFGVSRGTSIACMHRALRQAGLANVRLIGFDSFCGLPDEAVAQGWEAGAYASTLGATKQYLNKMGVPLNETILVKGWFRDTLTASTVSQLKLRKASIIMVDSDLYTSAKEALFFVEPLIIDRAVIIFDNWGWHPHPRRIGEREAFVEFTQASRSFKFDTMRAYAPRAKVFMATRLMAS